MFLPALITAKFKVNQGGFFGGIFAKKTLIKNYHMVQ